MGRDTYYRSIPTNQTGKKHTARYAEIMSPRLVPWRKTSNAPEGSSRLQLQRLQWRDQAHREIAVQQQQ